MRFFDEEGHIFFKKIYILGPSIIFFVVAFMATYLVEILWGRITALLLRSGVDSVKSRVTLSFYLFRLR